MFLVFIGITTLLPFIHVLAISLSSSRAVMAGEVMLWPIEFTVKSYNFVVSRPAFLKSILESFFRIAVAMPIYMVYIIITAYPLSKEPKEFKWRSFYVWFIFITMLINGGLIPTYFVIKQIGLYNSRWALIVPLLVFQVFNIILLLNFFRQLPKSLEEAAFVDGANYWQVLLKIIIPLSKPAIATVTLFVLVFHWNEWFHALIYMSNPDKYPLASYLRMILVEMSGRTMSMDDIEYLKFINNETSKAAQVFVGALPIILIYPFMQKFFVKGITLGSVKG
ncbi:carbohydrate ABC transporter permease [Vallitalea pronyensis]|uniref:carbohydrate ABC transporter permease n=1 Tax=Vallitalea pronyensis TaxID=1348613 RepID=UPI0038CD1C12